MRIDRVINAGRKRTVEECSGRACHSLTRFRNRIESVGLTRQAACSLAEADQLLESLAGKVQSTKLQVRTVDPGVVSRVDEILREILGHLEDDLSREKSRLTDIDQRIQTLLEQS